MLHMKKRSHVPHVTCVSKAASPFIVSCTHLTVTVRALLSSCLCLSNPTAYWASTLLDRTYMKAQTNLLLSPEIKKSLKMEDSWIAERALWMRERVWAKYPLCLSPFIGGALITVQVKLNMREISRAAGVGGGGGKTIKRRQGLGRAFKS